MTREETTSQIMTVVRDFNRKGEPIYLKKLMELIKESAEPTVSKYVDELIEEGKLKAQWVHNFDRRGHTKVLYAWDYYGEDRTLDPQMERQITELHTIGKGLERLNINIERLLGRGEARAVGPVIIRHEPEPIEPKTITLLDYMEDEEE